MAKQAIAAGDFATALRRLGDGVLSTDLAALRIEALIKSGDVDGAASALEDFARLSEANPALARLKAEAAIARGDDSLAVAIHAEALAARPDDPWHRLRIARAHVRLGAHDRALAAIGEGLAIRPGAFALIVEQAAILRQAGLVDEAARVLESTTGQVPDHAAIFRQRAELASVAGDHAAAAGLHAEASRREPHIPGHRIRCGRSLAKDKRWGDALATIEAGLAAFPTSAPLLAEIVDIRVRRGEGEAAAGGLAALASAYPHHRRTDDLHAGIAGLDGDHRRAARHLEAQMRRFPGDAGRAVQLADQLRRAGDRPGAMRVLDAIDRPTPRSRMLAALMLIELGRLDECRALLERWAPIEGDTVERRRTEMRRTEMRLASAEYRFVDVRAAADDVLALLPHDAEAARARALGCTMSFDTDAAWLALKDIAVPPVGGGPLRRNGRRLRSLYGHLANDFRLRDSQTRRLRLRMGEGEPALQHEAATILRGDPHSMPAALALLTSLARTGALYREIAGVPAGIPLLLHQYWDRDLPDDVRDLIGETRRANSDLVHQLWDDDSARAFLGGLDDPRYLEAYRRARHVAIRSDLFRLALLWRCGGIHMDADDLALAPVRTLLPDAARLVLHHTRMGSLGNNFIAAVPGHPLIGAMLDQAADEILAGAADSPWLATGPGLLSRVVATALAQDEGALAREGVRILRLGTFRAVVDPGRRVGYKTGARHWQRAD